MGRSRLEGTGQDALLEVVAGCFATRSAGELSRFLVGALPAVVDADVTVFIEADFRHAKLEWTENPTNASAVRAGRDVRDVAWRYRGEHPTVRWYRRTGDGRAVKLSDFVTEQVFARTALYNEFYRPLGLRHAMSFRLPRPRHLLVGFSLNRARHDFREEDRMRLNVLRPHLIKAYENAQAWDRVLADCQSLEEAVEASRVGLVLLGEGGRVEHANALGVKAIDRYFDQRRTRAPDRLPGDLEEWVRGQARIREDLSAAGSEPLVVARDGRRLVVRLVSGASRSVLVLREVAVLIEARLVRALGLSD
jgi:PAS domain-containing protein